MVDVVNGSAPITTPKLAPQQSRFKVQALPGGGLPPATISTSSAPTPTEQHPPAFIGIHAEFKTIPQTSVVTSTVSSNTTKGVSEAADCTAATLEQLASELRKVSHCGVVPTAQETIPSMANCIQPLQSTPTHLPNVPSTATMLQSLLPHAPILNASAETQQQANLAELTERLHDLSVKQTAATEGTEEAFADNTSLYTPNAVAAMANAVATLSRAPSLAPPDHHAHETMEHATHFYSAASTSSHQPLLPHAHSVTAAALPTVETIVDLASALQKVGLYNLTIMNYYAFFR